ncbi:hypothetical protein NAEGRDRAFT_49668 [Naegleria gruberi]|uniref:Defective in cullin neddylation protein n=1 Tax=Naegleria gruberi TaxID=5762 RepID=D2VHW0_NAEGR|nr:uncharacterized protein NAEGRDRAFT_49668 [Naegleria gruberi]EFC43661.1 hypothetical protein NAEGRDRAFT_49668 [Naegleria gruberi]|eukprot:XP_002676405.1 hypothetical protein NAEGRDRAFT_49668 [Naegleria gruberi strain NEG-M]
MGQKGSSNSSSSSSTTTNSTYNNHSNTSNQTKTTQSSNNSGNNNTSNNTTAAASTTTTNNTSSTTNSVKSGDEMEKLYAKYAAMDVKDPDSEDDVDYIGTEGLLKLAEDIGINPEQRIMLIMLYKIGATEQYKVKHKEFVDGFKRNNCQSLSDMKSKVSSWEQPITSNNTEFKKFYVWCYNYSKEPGAKSMSCEMASATWRLLLSDRYKKINEWCDYIENTYKRAIQKDSWDLFIDFVHNVGDDLSRYDSNDAWPVIVDDWCTLLQKKQ